MDDNARIIDIEPLDASRSSTAPAEYEVPSDAAAGTGTGQRQAHSTPYQQQAHSAPHQQQTHYIPRQQQRTYTVMYNTSGGGSSFFRRFAGLFLALIGLICVLVGIPLLILPGPGLLVIALGVALVTGGVRMLFAPGRSRQNTNTHFTQNPTTNL